MQVKIKRLYPNAVLPTYAHGPEEDAGMDLRAIEEVILRPGAPALVKTGLSIELPPGYEAQIRPRSGLALKHGITCANAVGTIDPAYRGEVSVLLVWGGHNSTGWYCKAKEVDGDGDPWWPNSKDTATGLDRRACPDCQPAFRIAPGDRIAQMVIARYEPIEWQESELSETVRGAGGFGSSGLGEVTNGR